jgi:N6-L-threonylcarbamoyladenine synthase
MPFLNQSNIGWNNLGVGTDNGAMITMAAAMRLQNGQQNANTDYAFDVKSRWPFDMLQNMT